MNENYLMHWKYTKKYKNKNGKMVYVYGKSSNSSVGPKNYDAPGRDDTSIHKSAYNSKRYVKGKGYVKEDAYNSEVYYDSRDSKLRVSDLRKEAGYRSKDTEISATKNGKIILKQTKIYDLATGKEMSPLQVNITSDINKIKSVVNDGKKKVKSLLTGLKNLKNKASAKKKNKQVEKALSKTPSIKV